jgi:hypothetical protein
MTEKYFKELARILAMNDIQTGPPESNTLPILLNGHSVCRVEPSGEMCIFPDDVRSPEGDELYQKVAPFSQMVKEYLTAIERAPLLKATALDEDFRLLAEYNGAVLAVLDTKYGYKFATWERDYQGTGVVNGDYYLDGYTAAKQDFAIRAGLIEKQRLFSDDQLLEIYRSVNDTFDAGHNLTYSDEKKLYGIQKQIESLLPDIKEQAATMRRTDADTMQGQSM